MGRVYEDEWVVLVHEVVACSLEEPGCSTARHEAVEGEETPGSFDPYQAIEEADGRFPAVAMLD